MSTNTKPKTEAKTGARRVFPAKEKCEAVLAVWAERRKPAEICRELGIPWQQLDAWQKAAMSGLMTALQPRQNQAEGRGPSLSPRLEKLLERTEQRVRKQSKLEKRLEAIQKTGAEKSVSA